MDTTLGLDGFDDLGAGVGALPPEEPEPLDPLEDDPLEDEPLEAELLEDEDPEDALDFAVEPALELFASGAEGSGANGLRVALLLW